MALNLYYGDYEMEKTGVLFFILVLVFFLACSNTEDLEWIEAINNKALSANVTLLIVTEKIVSTSIVDGIKETVIALHGSAQSGAIIRKEEGKYYALTTVHGPIGTEASISKILVFGYDNPLEHEDINMYLSLDADYSHCYEATIEYYDVAYDLAIVSFYCENEYTALPISSEPPQYNTPVAAMGNPHGRTNAVTIGQISSKKPVTFNFTDSMAQLQQKIIKHTALINPGTSGGALLNKKMEIIGINLGMEYNSVSGKFLYGITMPCDKILEFLNKNDYK